MTPADRQLVDWCRARGWMSLATCLAIGYVLMRASGREVSAKLTKECEKTLDGLRTQRMQELAWKAAHCG